MLKLFANEKASRWLYSYQVDWDEKVEAVVSAANAQASREEVHATN
ncbi:MAG TPA: hypothetical protein VKY19_21195 [Ktedonosporobacter sp.]|jgi:hypothetical protein|nr:hypothetical protein [Ktedonosporobacter sp.]